MESDLQNRFDGQDAYRIMQQLKAMFQKHARRELFELNCKILQCDQKRDSLLDRTFSI